MWDFDDLSPLSPLPSLLRHKPLKDSLLTMSYTTVTSSAPLYSAILQQPPPSQKAPEGYFKSAPTNSPLVNPDGSSTGEILFLLSLTNLL